MEKVKRAIVFIDGNNFYHSIKKTGIKPSDIDFQRLTDAVCEHFGAKRKKTIYYNSLPDISEGQEKYYTQIRFFDKLKNLLNFEVRTRKLQRHSKKETLQLKKEQLKDLDLCETCRPIVEANCMDCIGKTEKKEKGIDVMISIDIIDAAGKDTCDMCILISGDADFVPALERAKKRGKEVRTASLPKGYSSQLRGKFRYLVLDSEFLSENCLRR